MAKQDQFQLRSVLQSITPPLLGVYLYFSLKRDVLRRLVLLCVLSIMAFNVKAQDTEFWFVAPDVEIINNTTSISFCDSPTRLVLTAGDRITNVTIRYKGGSMTINKQLAANQTEVITFMRLPLSVGAYSIHDIENQPTSSPSTKNKFGIQIESSEPIYAYYQADGGCLKDLFVLKGSKALGKLFYTPFQNQYPLNYAGQVVNNNRSINIVATEDNTSIIITPKNGKLLNCGTGVFTINLQKGETWAGVSLNPSQWLGGTKIESDKDIAVTVYESTFNGDMAGDQLVPVNQLGKDYVVVRSYNAATVTGNEYAFIVATEDATTINVIRSVGVNLNYTLNAGETQAIPITEEYYFIKANKAIYTYQLSAYFFGVKESGEALLPSMHSIQSKRLAFYKTPEVGLTHSIFLITHKDNVSSFLVNGASGKILTSDFQSFSSATGFGDWRYARKTIDSWANGIQEIRNSKGAFSLGYLYGASWAGSFGYLSGFGAGGLPSKTHMCPGEPIILDAGYGKSYLWSTGATTPSITVSTPGNYWVDVDLDPTIVRQSTEVVTGYFNASVDANAPTLLGDETDFSVTSTSSITSYQWTFPDGIPATANTATPTAIKWSTAGVKPVSVKITNATCDTTLYLNVQVDLMRLNNDTVRVYSKNINTFDVLPNDLIAACGGSAAVSISGQPSNSIATASTTVDHKKVVYNSTADFATPIGLDTLRYTVTCGTNTATAEVYLLVLRKPDMLLEPHCGFEPKLTMDLQYENMTHQWQLSTDAGATWTNLSTNYSIYPTIAGLYRIKLTHPDMEDAYTQVHELTVLKNILMQGNRKWYEMHLN